MSSKKPAVTKKATPAAKPAAKAAPAPVAAKKPTTTSATTKKTFHDAHSHLFPKAPRSFGIGRAIRPTSDLTRYVKWPRYVRLQRQRAILKKRLKVPPAINQFAKALDKNQAATLFRLLAHYRPESREEKSKRLKAKAESEVKGKAAPAAQTGAKPLFVKYGLNHVTTLIEAKKAKLVVIAHDVDPIELVIWLPALCRKMNVPYVIVKGKSRLGHVVHKKTASVLAITETRKEDQAKFEQFISNARIQFNDNVTDRKRWGGGIMGAKAQVRIKKHEKAVARSNAGKA